MSATFSLHLRYQAQPAEAKAWLIPGSSARAWLDEMNHWNYPLDKLQILSLPNSLSSHSPLGVLVVGTDLGQLKVSSAVIPYQRLGKKLFLPCNAELHPKISSQELESLLRYQLAVYHPSAGLIGFEISDISLALSLLEKPAEQSVSFSWAHPGYDIPQRLYAITPVATERLSLILQDVDEEIGNSDLSELPPTPEEKAQTGVAQWRDRMKIRFLEALKQLTGLTPSSDNIDPTWVNRLEDWADQRIESLKNEQERELKRLLHLLKHDPDEGLNYALPIAGDQHRGQAPPSTKLRKRDPDFDLNRLGGGGKAALWVLNSQNQFELSQQYRVAANRELAQGRHRRAAYIYSELLKDHRAAANVLRQGGYHREASVLYMKQLADKLEAARCLREGGYLAEAIPIYEQKKHFETAAELYQQLGEENESQRCYRLAVSRSLAHGKTIHAATLLDQQLNAPEEAIELLQKAWPRSSDACQCLTHELSLYQRLKNFTRLTQRLQSAVDDHPPDRAIGLMEILVKQSRQSTEGNVRATAERGGYDIAGRWVGSPNFKDQRAMLTLVRRLAPEDRLLLRDTVRYADHFATATDSPSLMASSSDAPITWLDRHPLPNWVQWFAIAPRGRSGFFALGSTAQGTTLMRYHWAAKNFQTQFLPRALTPSEQRRVQLVSAHESLPEIVSLIGLTDIEPITIPPSDIFPHAVRVENPPWAMGDTFLGMTYSQGGVGWTVHCEQGGDALSLLSYSHMGDLIGTHTLPSPCPIDRGIHLAPIPTICAREADHLRSLKLLVRYYRQKVEVLVLDHEPTALYHSPGDSRLRIAVPRYQGAEIIWGDSAWGRRRQLPFPLQEPKVAFTPTGNAIVLSPGRIDLLGDADGTYVPLHSEEIDDTSTPLGIFATEDSNIYALVTAQTVHRCRVDVTRMNPISSAKT